MASSFVGFSNNRYKVLSAPVGFRGLRGFGGLGFWRPLAPESPGTTQRPQNTYNAPESLNP